MKLDKFGNILKTIKANYSNFSVLDAKEAIMIWFELLKD
ncbi:replicative helicase loader/inhibitor [Peptoniphilus raoultii]|nr:replicative helicase loader/inhibitor [Peptoniphilus raoultii]